MPWATPSTHFAKIQKMDSAKFNVPAGAVRLTPLEMNNLHLREAGRHTAMADRVPPQTKTSPDGTTPLKRPLR